MTVIKKLLTSTIVALSFIIIVTPTVSAQRSEPSWVKDSQAAARRSAKQAREQGYGNKRTGSLGKKTPAEVSSNVPVKHRKVYLVYGGNIYSNARLSYASHYADDYAGEQFTITRKETVKRPNGKHALYYHVSNSHVSGWVWHKNTKSHLTPDD